MTTLPVLYELPKAYLEGIGAVCFEWSLVERALQQITYGLLKIGPKHGRVAVRSPRASDQANMIRQLMRIESLTTNRIDMAKMVEVLGKLEKHRDMFAHGIWMERKKDGRTQILLQDISGTWKPDPRGPKVARRISPEGIIVDAEGLTTLAKAIKETRLIAESLARELEAKLRASL